MAGEDLLLAALYGDRLARGGRGLIGQGQRIAKNIQNYYKRKNALTPEEIKQRKMRNTIAKAMARQQAQQQALAAKEGKKQFYADVKSGKFKTTSPFLNDFMPEIAGKVGVPGSANYNPGIATKLPKGSQVSGISGKDYLQQQALAKKQAQAKFKSNLKSGAFTTPNLITPSTKSTSVPKGVGKAPAQQFVQGQQAKFKADPGAALNAPKPITKTPSFGSELPKVKAPAPAPKPTAVTGGGVADKLKKMGFGE